MSIECVEWRRSRANPVLFSSLRLQVQARVNANFRFPAKIANDSKTLKKNAPIGHTCVHPHAITEQLLMQLGIDGIVCVTLVLLPFVLIRFPAAHGGAYCTMGDKRVVRLLSLFAVTCFYYGTTLTAQDYRTYLSCFLHNICIKCIGSMVSHGPYALDADVMLF